MDVSNWSVGVNFIYRRSRWHRRIFPRNRALDGYSHAESLLGSNLGINIYGEVKDAGLNRSWTPVQFCIGWFYMSTLLGHGVPRCLVKRYSQCVCQSVSGWDSIWIGGFSKADCPPQCGWTLSNLRKTWIEQKTEEGRINLFSACLSWDSSLLLPLDWDLEHQLPWFLGLQTQTEVYHWPTWVSSLKMADWGTS